ncbi:uncharacterized protein EAE97_003103 [Botrytis byssoidea]|uniref:Uncharacterized protein n=1 Tax=Botrytis byssoidea TaxID=139641 RepID=A0A9P5M1T3_9HELO|nr:uncharacterized protein EAE97_003103 [Botrytis byssoidea]KAF7949594.1 hypothetical protein EAE97_003103 [Botrytis byssoidea]
MKIDDRKTSRYYHLRYRVLVWIDGEIIRRKSGKIDDILARSDLNAATTRLCISPQLEHLMLPYAQRENTKQRPSGFSVDIIPQSNDSHLEIGGIPKQIYGLATPQVMEVDFRTDPLSNYSDLEIEEVLEQIFGSTLAPVGVNSLATPPSNGNDLESEEAGKREMAQLNRGLKLRFLSDQSSNPLIPLSTTRDLGLPVDIVKGEGLRRTYEFQQPRKVPTTSPNHLGKLQLIL